MKAHNGMRPHDVVVLLKIIALPGENWLKKDLSSGLFISPSEISESLNRSMIARLISPDKRKVQKNALLKFIENGIGFVFPVEIGAIVRGMPTAHSSPLLQELFVSKTVYVWPDPQGKSKGKAVAPLYPNQVKAALEDQNLYQMLSLVDAIRIGKPRECEKALELLRQLFNRQYA
ncbi:hypothetical protein [Pedobacter glucosidilyticus]|uniref:hypothetical protein n=1 Tax=Pedobacter glucosidilyticus TaxID=1122941 RepID=UPI0026EE1A69|nr:hypothetical protein [Pedobacter glucosidilyticus]